MIQVPRLISTFTFLLAWCVPWRPSFRVRAAKSKLLFAASYRDVSGRHIAKYGGIESHLTNWISTFLSTAPSGVFVDIGANIGWHSIHASQQQAVETVVAFEPDVFNIWLLDQNLSLNSINKVVVNASAVGARRGLIRLYRYKRSNAGRHSVLTDYGRGSRIVPMTDLDSALSSHGLSDRRVLVLKIDVEGYEPAVLAGARQTLARTDAVITEFSPELSHEGGLSIGGMIDQLQAAGFTAHIFSTDNTWTVVTKDELDRVDGQVDLVWTRAAQ